MSKHASTPQADDEQPLFQNTDQQEQIYAPEQLPTAAMPVEEIDRGGTAGSGTAVAGHASDTHTSDIAAGRTNVAGAEGDQQTTPIVGVRPDVSASTPIMMPATPDDRRLSEDTTNNDS